MKEYPCYYMPKGDYDIQISFEPPKQSFFTRVGTILFFKDAGEVKFIMPIDSTFGSICDFGGKTNKGELWYDAIRREFNEESYGLLEYGKKSLYIWTYKSLICFNEVAKPDVSIIKKIEEEWLIRSVSAPKHLKETRSICILDKNDFIYRIKSYDNSVWMFLRDLLSSVVVELESYINIIQQNNINIRVCSQSEFDY